MIGLTCSCLLFSLLLLSPSIAWLEITLSNEAYFDQIFGGELLIMLSLNFPDKYFPKASGVLVREILSYLVVFFPSFLVLRA